MTWPMMAETLVVADIPPVICIWRKRRRIAGQVNVVKSTDPGGICGRDLRLSSR